MHICVWTTCSNSATVIFFNCTKDAILGTFQDNGGTMFWTIGSKMPVQANPIVCWKFLQVIHKLMRDGHPNVSACVCILMYVCTSEGRWEWGVGWMQICTLASAHYLYMHVLD